MAPTAFDHIIGVRFDAKKESVEFDAENVPAHQADLAKLLEAEVVERTREVEAVFRRDDDDFDMSFMRYIKPLMFNASRCAHAVMDDVRMMYALDDGATFADAFEQDILRGPGEERKKYLRDLGKYDAVQDARDRFRSAMATWCHMRALNRMYAYAFTNREGGELKLED